MGFRFAVGDPKGKVVRLSAEGVKSVVTAGGENINSTSKKTGINRVTLYKMMDAETYSQGLIDGMSTSSFIILGKQRGVLFVVPATDGGDHV